MTGIGDNCSRKKVSRRLRVLTVLILFPALLYGDFSFSKDLNYTGEVTVEEVLASGSAGRKIERMNENKDRQGFPLNKLIPEGLDEKSYLLGKYDPASIKGFEKVPPHLNADGREKYLRSDVLEAFKKMAEAALRDGITLKIISAFRSYDYQAGIFRKKLGGKNDVPFDAVRKALTFSAMPGTSRHHWGTEVDLNSLEASYFRTGKGRKEYSWLLKHAAEYGFMRPYSEGRKKGHADEPWHWSYAPVSAQLLERYNELISEEDLAGTPGVSYLKKLRIFEDYVNGINPLLKPDYPH